ncbi:hypothetical protein Patl1_35453 [Pistacia atlantica]|nr:hypothetical protein Patl1_35453 [Pistacia atlantica]
MLMLMAYTGTCESKDFMLASFRFDDHNCPPIQLIISFCHSAYSWLKQDIENVVVVLVMEWQGTGFFHTVEESIYYYNQKRCVDGKGLVLPSQIRYVKYFERVLTYFNGENQPGRRYTSGHGLLASQVSILDRTPPHKRL